jgi:hypothetical protein
MQCWYPKVSDLTLPDVPAGERAEVRKILSWLGKFPVRGGTCWQTAKAVTLLSHDPRVEYVEGVSWNVKQVGAGYAPLFQHDGECPSDICMCQPLPHAWNLVNGHVVDLLAEFSNWRFGAEYLHEPLKVCSAEDLVGRVPGNFSVTQKAWMEQHQDREPESMAAICQHVFKEAVDRLVQKSQDLIEANGMTNEQLIKALRMSWERHDGKTIKISEGEPTFDAKDFIESLSYSNSKIQDRTPRS